MQMPDKTAPRSSHLAEHAAGFAWPAQGEKTATKDDSRLPGFTWQTQGGAFFVPFTSILINRHYEPAHVAAMLGKLDDHDTEDDPARLPALREALGEDVVFTPIAA
jgi:hypothetical protein